MWLRVFLIPQLPSINIEDERETYEYLKDDMNIHMVAIASYKMDKLSPMDIYDDCHTVNSYGSHRQKVF